MLAAAKQQGFDLVAFSGYRSFEYQTTLYDNYVKRDGQAAADRYSARPGYSEHQTGLAFDIGERGKEVWLTEEFGETPAGQWLFTHAQEYGFILRFPQNKEEITGYMYESWHYRYVGKEVAKEITKEKYYVGRIFRREIIKGREAVLLNRLSSFLVYKIGVNKREIDSLNLISVDRFLYISHVNSVQSKISFSNSSANWCDILASYMKALTSKFRLKLRTSIFAVPTEDASSSIIIALAWIKPFS